VADPAVLDEDDEGEGFDGVEDEDPEDSEPELEEDEESEDPDGVPAESPDESEEELVELLLRLSLR
jgi:hypothetical protein